MLIWSSCQYCTQDTMYSNLHAKGLYAFIFECLLLYCFAFLTRTKHMNATYFQHNSHYQQSETFYSRGPRGQQFLQVLLFMRYGVRFHVNMERSRFPRRNRVDYKALNVLSTVDLEVHLKGRRKFKSGSKVYFVERLISRRRLKNEVCVLTLLCSCSYILLRMKFILQSK